MLRFKISALILFVLFLFAALPSHAQTSQIPFQCKDTSGSGTSQSCNTVLTLGPVSGDSIIYTTTTVNTGDITVNVDGKGPIHIRKWLGSSVLLPGDLPANVPVQLIFDGTYWEIQTIGNPPTGTGNVSAGSSFAAKGNPVLSVNNGLGVISSAQSFDCTVYGVTGNGSTDDTVAMQACANAIPVGGGTMRLPSNLTVFMTASGGLPITFPHMPVVVDCSSGANYGAATTFFETNTASYLFRVGTINNGSAQQQGVIFRGGCGFQDSSAGHNTALGGILFSDVNNSGIENSQFYNFNRSSIPTPAAPTISVGSGSTSYWVQIVCTTDMGGNTVFSSEATATLGSTTLTVTAPGSAGCPAPSSGYRVLASTSGTGTETLQAASGCTLNATATACGLTNNWSGAVAAGNLPEAFFKYDTSAGVGFMVDGQTGANATAEDASYGHFDNNTFQNTQECMLINGGIQEASNNHFSQCTVYGLLTNRQNAQVYSDAMSIEIPNTTTARGIILNGTSPSHITAKFEGAGSGNTNITCAEVNSSRNFIGGNWLKCGVRLIQENAGVVSNTYDIHNQVSNNASPLISAGNAASDIILGDTLNGGPGSFFPQVNVVTNLLYPVAAGFTASSTSMLGYDSTNKNTHVESNGGDGILAPLAAGFVSGHCGQPTQTGGVWTTADAGAACGSGGGGSGTVSGQASNVIPLGTSASVISRQSHLDDGNTTAGTITSSEPLVATTLAASVSANPGLLTLPGNTGTPSIGSGLFGILGPNTASFTSYVLQMSSTAPSGTQELACGTPVSNISACSWISGSGAVASVSNSDGTLTISPTTGVVVASLNLAQANSWSAAGTASTPGMSITGAPYTGGTATTNFPQFYINDGTGPTTLSTAGTEFGINTPSGFTGNLEDYHVNGGASVANLSYLGAWTAFSYTSNGATAGFLDLPQGSTSASVAPCNASTSICIQAPTSVTSYVLVLPGAQPTAGNTALNCTAANPSVCSWSAGSGGGVSSIATTSPITGGTITSTGTIACATCVTSAASLTSTAFMTGAGSQGSQTPNTGATLSSGGAPTFPGIGTFSAAGAASTSGLTVTGAPYTGGSATTNFPQLYVNDGTGPTTFSANGTEFGINTPSGFTGNLFDAHVNGGASVANLNYLGAWSALSYTSLGTTAGFVDFPQGSTSASTAPCNSTTSICEQAPTSVTSYLVNKPGVAATGIETNNVATAVDTQGFSGDANHSTTISFTAGQTVGATSLCSTANCPVGTYQVTAYVDVTTACSVSGTLTVWVGYTDDAAAKGSISTTFIPIEGAGSAPATGVLTTTATTNYGQGTFILRSTGAAAINYGYTTSACGSGSLAGKIYLSVVPWQS